MREDQMQPDNAMKASSHTLTSSSCFMAVKLTFERVRPATPNRSKRAKARRVGGGGGGGGDNDSQGSVILPTDVAFKSLILTALKEMFGELGSVDYPVDVLSWDPVNREGQLRVPARCVVPVRAALTLVGSCGNTPCAISVTEASPFLAGIACERYL